MLKKNTPIAKPKIGFFGKNKNIIIPIKKGAILSINSVSANAPVGKIMILVIKAVVIANAIALIHFAKKLSFCILLDKTTPKNLQTKIPELATKSIIQGIISGIIIEFSYINFILIQKITDHQANGTAN